MMNIQYSLIADKKFLIGLQVAVESIVNYCFNPRIVVYSPDSEVLSDPYLNAMGCRLIPIETIGEGYTAYGRYFPPIVATKVLTFESIYPDNDYVIFMDADCMLIRSFQPVIDTIENMKRQVYGVGMFYRFDNTGDTIDAGLAVNAGFLAIPAELATKEYIDQLKHNILTSKSGWEEKAISEVYNGKVNVSFFAPMYRIQEATIQPATQWIHYCSPKPWINEEEGRKLSPLWWNMHDKVKARNL